MKKKYLISYLLLMSMHVVLFAKPIHNKKLVGSYVEVLIVNASKSKGDASIVAAENNSFLIAPHGFSLNAPEETSCSLPVWYEKRDYSVNYYVSYNNKVYQSNGWIGNSEAAPPSNTKWTLIGDCTLKVVPLTTDCDSAKTWNEKEKNYNASDKVMYNNGLYKAKYWVAGSARPDKSEAYDFIGVCVTPPEITSTYSNATTIVQSSIQNVLISAKILDFGFSPLAVDFMVKEKGASTYTKHSMKNSSGDLYTFSWTPSSYGDFEIIIKATNLVDVSSEMISSIKIALSTPPIVRLGSPKNNSKFIQLNFEPIEIVFTATKTAKELSKIWVKDITASTSNTISVAQKDQYTYQWTPKNYGKNTLELVVEDVLGTSTTVSFSYMLVDPSKETVSFTSLPNQIKGIKGVTKVFTFDEKITKVLSRRVDLCNLSFSGNTLTVSNPIEGRTGLEITTDKGSYYVGLRIDKKNGEVAELPGYLSLGSVSEDIGGDIKFWRDLDNTNLLKNKRMDIRYIYVNGGPLIGWNTWQPDRVTKFTRNSLKLGIIPLFVFYNIPDGGESYTTNKGHIENPTYMKAYFKNLTLFFDHVKQEVGDEMFMVILEPDFLGYMQQNNQTASMPTSVGLNSIGNNAGTLQTLVQRINMEINNRREKDNLNFVYGWQYNLWAKGGVSGAKGIVRETDTGDFATKLAKIKQTGADITKYGMELGTLSHDADFISIDKYGLDALGAPSGKKDPDGYTWFWNNDHWLNYLAMVKSMSETANKHVILWQLPVGHINGSQAVSEYTGAPFPLFTNKSKHYEDSASTFFFGDEVDFSNNTDRFSYFSQNKHKDPKLKVDAGTKHVTFGDHFAEANKSGVRIVLMGAGVGDSTDGVGAPPTDDYYWIQKVQRYYTGQLTTDKVDADKDGVFDNLDKCPNTPSGEKVDSKGCSDGQLDDDNDGVPNSIDDCPNTLIGVTVNKKGCVDNQQDSDNDGVLNASDQYPNTPNGAVVDGNGGVILSGNTFSLSQTGLTCPNKNNGTITLTNASPYLFDVQFSSPNKPAITIEDALEAKGSHTITNLPPGEYRFTMKFDKNLGIDIGEYVVKVADAAKISGKVLETDKASKTTTVKVKNAKVYHVKVNGNYLKTVTFKTIDSHQIVVPLSVGDNHVNISTDATCRGSVDTWITIAGSVEFYPNPTVGDVFIRGLKPGMIHIKIVTLSGQVVKTISKQSADGTLQLSVAHLHDGVYIVHLSGSENKNILPFKIVKK